MQIDQKMFIQSVNRDHHDFDKLFKIRPIIKILKNSFRDYYNFGQNVSVDKAMVKGKGWNPLKQYMPMKPVKRGSKLWCIGCSCYANLWDFQIYTGKVKHSLEKKFSHRVVCDLCHPALDNRGHVVYIDNFFTVKRFDNELELVEDFKYLGVIFSSRMTWSNHIYELSAEINKHFGLLKWVKHLLRFDQLLYLNTLVLLFDYGDMV